MVQMVQPVQPAQSTRVEKNNSNDSMFDQLKLGFMINQARQVDMERMMHPMAPPVRRGTFTGMSHVGNMPVNVPTRGEYGPFHMMGYLHNAADPNQAMPLMGRRVHSNQHEYYTFHHNNPAIKIPIKMKKEIDDGQTVNVSTYPGSNFTASIYDVDVPRYVPY